MTSSVPRGPRLPGPEMDMGLPCDSWGTCQTLASLSTAGGAGRPLLGRRTPQPPPEVPTSWTSTLALNSAQELEEVSV